MKTIVISAVNLVEGGPLSILSDCLNSIESLSKKYKIIVLVNSKKLVSNIAGNFEYIEFPDAKKSWFKRIYYEYYYFNKISKYLKPSLWFSLHDITPNVQANKKAVYCHNPSPFYKVKFNEVLIDPKFTVFTLFYRYLYSINIKKNNFIIVQQDWIRKKFSEMYNLNQKKIIVAKPNINIDIDTRLDRKKQKMNTNKKTYIYPSFPRSFKNIEYICEAFKYIDSDSNEILLTINGDENRYAKKIHEKYCNVKGIKFIGLKSREEIFQLYDEVDGLIFPSKLETWGLPMSEFSLTGKQIFASNLPYAKEVLHDYHKVAYFDPNNPKELVDLLTSHDNEIIYKQYDLKRDSPTTENWLELFEILIE